VEICPDSAREEATADGESGRELDGAFDDSSWQNAPQAANKTKPATRIGTVPAIAPPTTNLDGSTPHATLLSYSAHYLVVTWVMNREVLVVSQIPPPLPLLGAVSTIGIGFST
jgi:hypothetical protein